MMTCESTQPEQYGITLKELQLLMELHDRHEGNSKIKKFGGTESICEKLHTSPTSGLSGLSGDLKRRREIFGTNKIPPKKQKSFIHLVWEALQNITLIVLIVAALVSVGLYFYTNSQADKENEDNDHGWIEGVAILISVFVVVIVTACNDYSKERQFRSLKSQINEEKKFSVIRKGEVEQIIVQEIVVGDICQIKYGDLLPADGILIRSNDLKVDESSLTGESDSVKKSVLSDVMLFSGTHVVEGSGKMLVTAVGIYSQAGEISKLLGVTSDTNYIKKSNVTKERFGHVKRQSSGSESSTHVTDVHAVRESGVTTETSSSSIKKQRPEKSVLQAKLIKLAIQIGYIGSSIAALTVVILIVRFCITKFVIDKKKWDDIYMKDLVNYVIIGVTILVVAVPEGLPLAVTLSLAYTARKMMRDNNLVRHIHACETMGNATTICSDKTGTLTTNKMTVVKSYICEEMYNTVPTFSSIPSDVADLIVQAISINSSYTSRIVSSNITGDQGKQVGNKTECALLGFVLALGKSYQEIRDQYPEHIFTRVYTFNSLRKFMSTVVPKEEGGFQLFIKGASEILLQKCTFTYDNYGTLKKFTPLVRTTLEKTIITPMAECGLRTITIAYRDFGKLEIVEWDNEDETCTNLTLLCVVGIEDPIRPEVSGAIRKCQRAGIIVRMVTGDNIGTARSIAIKCGILKKGRRNEIMESAEFNKRIKDPSGKVQQYLLDRVWPNLRVLARSSPTDKYNLVNGIIESKLNDSQEVVAVTGDGTNDAPALLKADVGFSMGITGTDVAKEASDIIITDDNFNSIVKAVMWGRNVYDSISKFLQFQLTVNIVAVILTFVGACALQDIPLKAVQMLWVNLIMDTLASLALATERPSTSLLLRKPYGRVTPLISKGMMKHILGQSCYQLCVLFALLFFGEKLLNIPSGQGAKYGSPPSQHFTFIFNTFVLMTLFNQINARNIHENRNMFTGIFSNYIFCVIWIGTTLMQIIIVEFGREVFSTQSLTLDQWFWCIFFGIGTLLMAQLLITIPNSKVPQILSWGQQPPEKVWDMPTAAEHMEPSRATILWIRGTKRIQNQLLVVNAFNVSSTKMNKKR